MLLLDHRIGYEGFVCTSDDEFPAQSVCVCCECNPSCKIRGSRFDTFRADSGVWSARHVDLDWRIAIHPCYTFLHSNIYTYEPNNDGVKIPQYISHTRRIVGKSSFHSHSLSIYNQQIPKRILTLSMLCLCYGDARTNFPKRDYIHESTVVAL